MFPALQLLSLPPGKPLVRVIEYSLKKDMCNPSTNDSGPKVGPEMAAGIKDTCGV